MSKAVIRHVVVLMLENRSYDNVLGGLYLDPDQPAPPGQIGLDGLVAGSLPSNADPGRGTRLVMQPAADTTVPAIDPGEPFADMAQQIWGLAQKPSASENPTSAGPLGMMGGFTTNYAQLGGGRNPQDVMTYLTPQQVPVTAFLASNFGVSDQWFGSAPTHTYANRAFAHCGGPGVFPTGWSEAGSSYLDDTDYYRVHPFEFGYDTVGLSSIFAQLDAKLGTSATPNWKVYFHDLANALVLQDVFPCTASEANVNFGSFDGSDYDGAVPKPFKTIGSTFLEDAATGRLPPYSFIEPRYLSNYAPTKLPPNSNHPGVGMLPSLDHYPPTDVTNGEVLLATVYNALATSPQWANTLLIVTYDEHGGLYDHVTPPAATPPGPLVPPAGENGYPFDSFGPRVPALIISPWIPPGSTVRPKSVPFDHTSLIKTVWEVFDLDTPTRTCLTQRDASAESVLGALTLQAPTNSPGVVDVPRPTPTS